MTTRPETLCPSAQPDWEGAQLFAVVGGTSDKPETAYLDRPQPLTKEILALAGPVEPAEVFRFAAPCAKSACCHFDEAAENCRLVEKTVRLAPIVFEKLPKCAIRSGCRWWQQEGVSACKRCPQVVTVDYFPSDEKRMAADPTKR